MGNYIMIDSYYIPHTLYVELNGIVNRILLRLIARMMETNLLLLLLPGEKQVGNLLYNTLLNVCGRNSGKKGP